MRRNGHWAGSKVRTTTTYLGRDTHGGREGTRLGGSCTFTDFDSSWTSAAAVADKGVVARKQIPQT